MGKGNWRTSKGMKKCWVFFFVVLVLVWDMVKLFKCHSILGKGGGMSGTYKQQE